MFSVKPSTYIRKNVAMTLVGSATPIAIFLREHASGWLALRPTGAADVQLSEVAARVLSAIEARGAMFSRDLAAAAGVDDDPLQTAIVELVAAGRPQPINYAPRAPGAKLRGRVIGIYGGVAQVGEAGPQQIISINRGKADGIEVGHVLALYNLGGSVRDATKPRNAPEARIQLPDERNGLAFVFRVFDRISYALVMQVTRPVSPLDVVQTP